MNEFISLLVAGLVTGAIYSIMASGLVLTYTTSGIFNFAHGAVAFATAYVFYQLNTGLSVPLVPALIVSAFVFAPVLGLLLDRILLRRLAGAPVYARIVGTIGLLVALPALTQWLVVTVGNDVLDLGLVGNRATTNGVPVPGVGPVPAHNFHLLDGVVLNSDQVAVFTCAALAAVVLWFVIRRTRVGLEMRAVVDRRSLANLRGINPARTSAIAWTMTMMLAGLGGVLIAPLFVLQDFVYTLVVLGSLAAVVLGGLRSIPIAFAGGLLLGVIQNLVAGYSDSLLPHWLSQLSGLKSAVPFLLVIVLLLVFGRDRTRRAGTAAEEIPPPDHRIGLSAWRRRLPWALWTIALIAFSCQWFGASWARADTYDQTVIAQSLAVGVIFLSFVVVTGFGGMVSLMQATFVTAGGFAAGWALSRDWGVDVPLVASHGQINFFWALVIGTLTAAAIGALVALPLTRLGGVNLALGTLAVAFFASLVPFATDALSHGESGWTIRQPGADLPGVNWLVTAISGANPLVKFDQPSLDLSQIEQQILVFLAIFGLLTLTLHALLRSPTGRAIHAVRSSEVAAAATGIRVHRTKVVAFAISGGIAGLGGVLLGVFSFTVSNSTAPPIIGLFWLALAVSFGIRRPGGALLAGFALAASPALLHWIANDLLPGGDVNALITSIYFVPILSGWGAINLAQEPDGILTLAGQQKLAKQRARARARRAPEAEASVEAPTDVPTDSRTASGTPRLEPLGTTQMESPNASPATRREAALELRNVTAGYDGTEVLHGVDLVIPKHTIVALLGANGAGKSTLSAVAAGVVATDAGTILIDGTDVTRDEPYQRARAGLLLVPEARGIFPGLTVDENLRILLRTPGELDDAFSRFPILETRRQQVAGMLSGGEQQMLSLAPALTNPPKILIADEPTLGLAPLAATAVIDAIVELRTLGTAVLLIEEHARNALAVADQLACMQLGDIVWEGPTATADLDTLADAYLGRGVATTNADLPELAP